MMKSVKNKASVVVLILTLIAVSFTLQASAFAQNSAVENIPLDPEMVRPLKVGAQVPQATVQNMSGKEIDLRELALSKPTVLIFYRGGWCPYCNTHLSELSVVEPALVRAGYQLIALSPDSPATIRQGYKQSVQYTILSDSKMNAAKAFGLAFKVDDQTVHNYKKEHKIDLEGDSGETHHLLPVPAAYIINSEGVIVFAYSKSNYKVRMDPGLLLEKAEQALTKH